MIPHQRTALAIGVVLACLAGPAVASPITETFNISASNFSPTGPTDPVTGSFTITFDPTLPYTNVVAGISGGLNIAVGSALAFSFSPTANNGLLDIGGAQGGVGGLPVGANDYVVTLSNLNTGTPTLFAVDYETATGGAIFESSTGSVRATIQSSGIPEPITLSIFGAGLAGAAAMRRRKAKKG